MESYLYHMHRLVFITIVLQILTSLASSAQTQDLEYRIVWKNDSVGHLQVAQYDSSGFAIYRIDSEVEIWFFGTKNIRYNYYSRYQQGKLVRSTTRYTKNEQIKAQSSLRWENGEYDIWVDGDKQEIAENELIDCSVTTIYVHEPQSRNKIFSERFGQFLTVTELAPHHYAIGKPDGRPTEYIFKNGICSKVIVDNFFATFIFERVRKPDIGLRN
jgi:hypothetical protein